VWARPYSSETWSTSEGADRHRRGLYTFLRRTAPYPSLVVFDAPSRELCTARRVATNTPLQALTALNDPAFFEAAQALAARILAEAPAGARERARLGFRLCTAREPDEHELAVLLGLQARQLERYRDEPEAARAVVGPHGDGGPEQAAWTVVANVFLNCGSSTSTTGCGWGTPRSRPGSPPHEPHRAAADTSPHAGSEACLRRGGARSSRDSGPRLRSRRALPPQREVASSEVPGATGAATAYGAWGGLRHAACNLGQRRRKGRRRGRLRDPCAGATPRHSDGRDPEEAARLRPKARRSARERE
jgi:hypothetical protein